MSLISECPTSDNLHTHMLELAECERHAGHSNARASLKSVLIFATTFARHPQLRLTQRIAGVTFDLLTSWCYQMLAVLARKLWGQLNQLDVEMGLIRKPDCCCWLSDTVKGYLL